MATAEGSTMINGGCLPMIPSDPCQEPEGPPDLFCWTKMGTEAGQELGGILRRKELERQLGEGIFVWGIGNSLAGSLRAARETRPTIPVLFSPIRAKPKEVDVNPSSLILWRRYFDEEGNVRPLPEHVLVTSRGTGERGKRKQAYALFCRTQQNLLSSTDWTVCFDELENFGSSKKLGFSQVTALVKRTSPPRGQDTSRCYQVTAVADLCGPLCARLADGVEMPASLAAEISAVAASAPLSQWREYVREVRRRASRVQFTLM